MTPPIEGGLGLSPPILWANGDLYTLVIAAVVFAASCYIHRTALKRQGLDSTEMLVGMTASSLTVGPLLMILLDPLNKQFGIIDLDFLQTVVTEARVTLWFACFVALINTVVSILRPRKL